MADQPSRAEVLSNLHLKTFVKARDTRPGVRLRERALLLTCVLCCRSTTPSLCGIWCSTRWTRTRATCSPRLRTTRRARCCQLRLRAAALTRGVLFSCHQATIYDNEHFGSYVAVVEQYINAASDYTAGGVRSLRVHLFPAESGSRPRLAAHAQDLHAVAWLSSEGTAQTHGDGMLAVGGADKTVSVISMASASVVSLLKGHTNVRTPLAAVVA